MFRELIIYTIAGMLAIGLSLTVSEAQVNQKDAALQHTLKGKVTDLISEEPLSGVSVTLKGTERSATSNEEGDYSISSLESGTYTVSVNHDGYEKYSKEVEIKSEDVELNIKLQPLQ